jgi:hypothetical protein
MVFEQPIDRDVDANAASPARTINNYAFSASGLVAQSNNGTHFLDDMFAKDFPSLIPAVTNHVRGINCGDRNDNLLGLLHRFQFMNLVTLDNTTTQFLNMFSIPNADLTISLVRSYFCYGRGGYRFKLILSGDTTQNPSGTVAVCLAKIDPAGLGTPIDPFTSYSYPFGRGGTLFETLSQKPSVEWHQPWHSRYAYNTNIGKIYLEDSDTVCSALRFYARGNTQTLKCIAVMAIDDSTSFGWACGVPSVTRPGHTV